MRERRKRCCPPEKDTKTEIWAQAVFAMLKGESIKSVSERFETCGATLYQLRRRAINAVRCEIENPIERKNPAHNRLPIETENKVARLCERHSTLSFYRINEKLRQLENETVNPKTIQQIRKRHFNQQKVYNDAKLAGQRIKFFETLNDLEAEDARRKVYFLVDYKTKIYCPPEKLV